MSKKTSCLAFLDRYFCTDVDYAPEEANVRYTRSSWNEDTVKFMLKVVRI
jgi:hypothetical protein